MYRTKGDLKGDVRSSFPNSTGRDLSAFNRGLVETRVMAFQNRMRRGFPGNDPFRESHSEFSSLFLLLAGIIGWLALITALRAQPGSLDPTFNPIFDWPAGSRVSALAVQTDDKLVVGGDFQTVDGIRRVALIRLLTNDSLDPDFQQRNPDGSDVFSSVTALVVKEDDRVVAGGSLSGTGTYGVARFNSDGSRDGSYDPATDPNPFAVRQRDGKSLVVDGGFRIKRLNPDGSPDPSFSSIQLGGGGPVPWFDSSNITAIAVQPNDKIIVATFFSRWIGTHFNVFRLESDGNWDNSFTPATADFDIFAIAVLHGGGILIGGQFSTVNVVSRSRLARLVGDNPADKPRITSQPVDRTAPVGGRVVFSVAVSSFEVPTLQWQFNDANIPGANYQVLELVNVKLEQAGEYRVIVKNTVGSVESAVARLVVLPARCPALSFDATLPFDSGPNPSSLAIADFNGDGKLDLAVANSTSNSVSVLLGRGDGNFQAAIQYAAGPNPKSVAVSDFNGDGKPDLALANFGATGAGSVSVLLGNGDGTFQSAANQSLEEYAHPTSAAVGDFNGDGKRDLALPYYSSTRVSVLLGRGDGTFEGPTGYSTGAWPVAGMGILGQWRVAIGEFNGDSNPDLIVINPGRMWDPQVPGSNVRGSLSVLPGNGDGSFRAPLNYPLEAPPNSLSMPYSVAVGDFNNDGKTDLALAIASHTYHNLVPVITFAGVSVLLGNGDGTFQKAANYTAGASPIGSAGDNPLDLAVGDFNGDGVPDLAVANQGSGPDASVSVLLGSGDGTFQPAVNFGAGARARFIGVGDFNGDLQPDLAVLSESNSVLLNTCGSSGPGLVIARKLDTVILSWPVSSTGFVCESTTSLSLTNWNPVVEALTTNYGRLEVTAPLNQSQRFFRLRKL